MFKKLDFYTVAAPVAPIVGFWRVYVIMVFQKIPRWPAMVCMAGYYAVGGLARHERHDNGSKSIKGLLLGAIWPRKQLLLLLRCYGASGEVIASSPPSATMELAP